MSGRRTLLRGAQVVTMAPNRPDAERIDILIDGSRILDLGEGLETAGAEVVDLSGRVVIPGLVNAHLHTWQTALRSAGADWTLLGYLTRMHGTIAPRLTSEDMAIATLGGAVSQLECGVTTLADWCHNNLTAEHTDAAIDALDQSGIRAVFLLGAPGRSVGTPYPFDELDRLLDGPIARNALLTTGMAVSGPQASSPEVAMGEFRGAIDREVIISMHQSGGPLGPIWDMIRDAGLLGPHTNIAHGAGISDTWLDTLVDAGVTFTATPENELGQGHGTPITGRLLQRWAPPSLGTDTDNVVAGEMLTAARVALAHQRDIDHARHRDATGTLAAEPSITSRQALSWATVHGARALGLADRVGQLEVGMQADLVAVDARQLNLWPPHDPVATALRAHPGNIEAVMVAGQWRKRDRALVGIDVESIRQRLMDSGTRLLAALGAPSETWS